MHPYTHLPKYCPSYTQPYRNVTHTLTLPLQYLAPTAPCTPPPGAEGVCEEQEDRPGSARLLLPQVTPAHWLTDLLMDSSIYLLTYRTSDLLTD